MAGKMKSKMGYKGGKNTMKTKMGMAGGRQPRATEMGAESNKQYVKRMFSMGMNTRMTNDKPMENKGYAAGKKVSMRSKMSTKGGMKGGKRVMKTKGYAKGGKS
tara:strand:+ start:671 stop:982 length:312 start_codon:yes stop_codon:yes gene_type:complete